MISTLKMLAIAGAVMAATVMAKPAFADHGGRGFGGGGFGGGRGNFNFGIGIGFNTRPSRSYIYAPPVYFNSTFVAPYDAYQPYYQPYGYSYYNYAPPVYYQPAPVYYQPAPVYYYNGAVLPPFYQPRVNFSFGFRGR